MINFFETVFSSEEWGRLINRTRMEYGIHVNDLCTDACMSASTYTKFEKKALRSSALACA